MEFALRCNELKCRLQLHERAVVTTCSHVFCSNCADSTGLSGSPDAQRTCPACNAALHNPDDVVVAALNPSEDYKTSVLSGLSPTIIMECASRGLAFHSYQTSQEISYQGYLAKGLTDKYDTLSQQMDQLIHDANSQIKALQAKLQAMQTEQEDLENKNFDLAKAFKDKTKAHQHAQKLYQQLKGKVMASQVADAAGDEAAYTFQTARGDRFIDRFPGTRTGTADYSQMNMPQQTGGGRTHNREFSRSSGNGGGIHLGPPFDPQLQRRGLGRNTTGHSAPVGTPSQAHRSQLPVLGGSRQHPYLNPDPTPSYRNSPMIRQPLAGGAGARGLGNFSLGGKSSGRTGGATNNGPLGR